MLILSRVCADFHDKSGKTIHRITPANRLLFHEAPEAIREDPLFRMLSADGSLEAAVAPARQKKLEAEPQKDTDASGKKIRAAAGRQEESAPETARKRE